MTTYKVVVKEILHEGLTKEEAEDIASEYNNFNKALTGCCDITAATVEIDED